MTRYTSSIEDVGAAGVKAGGCGVPDVGCTGGCRVQAVNVMCLRPPSKKSRVLSCFCQRAENPQFKIDDLRNAMSARRDVFVVPKKSHSLIASRPMFPVKLTC